MSGVVATIALFNARIIAHQATGKLLAGWTFNESPKDFSEGADSWPAVACWLPETSETNDRKTATTRVTLNYTVSIGRDGAIATDLEAAKQVFLNALDIDPTTLKLSPILSEFTIETSKVMVTKASFTAEVRINLAHEIKQERGFRS